MNTALPNDSRWWSKIAGYISSGSQFAERLAHYPDATVVWHSISPKLFGHVRDRFTVLKHVRGRKLIAVVHRGNFAHLFSSPVTRGTALRASEDISRFVFNDPILSEACAAWIPEEKRAVLPNSIEEALLVSDPEIDLKRSSRDRNTLRLLYLSNMIESKGYLDVVRAAGLLRERGVSFHLDMVGHWYREVDEKAYEAMIQSEGLSGCIVHHGPVSDRKKIKAFHLAADVFLLPTYYPTEAQPVSIIEALSAGTPVVTTAQGGIPGMVRDEIEALIVRPRNPAEIANAVERFSDPELWESLSRHCRQRFLDIYHPDVIREQWIALIDETERRDRTGVTIE